MTRVFVSHTLDDTQWSTEFANCLGQAGVDVFLRERDIAPGQVTIHEIDRAMAGADAAVLVLSAACIEDRTFHDEYATLLNESGRRGIRLIPVLHGPAGVQVPLLAGSRLWVDFRGLSPADRLVKAGLLAEVLADPAAPSKARAFEGVQAARASRDCSDAPPAPAFVVTYAAADAAYGEKLADWVGAAGLPCWSIAKLQWGSRFISDIRQQIRHSIAMIVVMSPAAEESPDVEREILEGLRHGREFFPVLLHGDRNFLLASSWCFDARRGLLPGEAELRRLRLIRSGRRPADTRRPTGPRRAPAIPRPDGTPLRRLASFLNEGEWAHADMWTTTMLLAAAGRLDTGWLETGDGTRLPLSLLDGIDAAWSAATGGAYGFRSQVDLYRLIGTRGTDLLQAADAYGWRSGRRAAARYEQFVAGGDTAPAGFYPTLRNPQVEAYPGWYDRWQSTVNTVHVRLHDWNEGNPR